MSCTSRINCYKWNLLTAQDQVCRRHLRICRTLSQSSKKTCFPSLRLKMRGFKTCSPNRPNLRECLRIKMKRYLSSCRKSISFNMKNQAKAIIKLITSSTRPRKLRKLRQNKNLLTIKFWLNLRLILYPLRRSNRNRFISLQFLSILCQLKLTKIPCKWNQSKSKHSPQLKSWLNFKIRLKTFLILLKAGEGD